MGFILTGKAGGAGGVGDVRDTVGDVRWLWLWCNGDSRWYADTVWKILGVVLCGF